MNKVSFELARNLDREDRGHALFSSPIPVLILLALPLPPRPVNNN